MGRGSRKGSVRRPLATLAADRVLARMSLVTAFARGRTSAPAERSPKRVLIVKVFGMGDSVLIRALMERVCKSHPETEIGVLVGAGTRELMTLGLPVRSHIYLQSNLTPGTVLSLWREIRESRYEAIVNFEQGSLAGTAFLKALGVKVHAGFLSAINDPKAIFLTHSVIFRETDSMWESFLRLARIVFPELPAGIPLLDLPVSPRSQRWVAEWWCAKVGSNDRLPIAMHVGSGPGMDFKRWPLDRFLALAERLRERWNDPIFILTGTAVERNLIDEFRVRFPGQSVDASNLGSLENTATVLKRCGLLISNDTGVMHLGAALGVPTVGLFGPTTPAHWAPLGPRTKCVRETSVSCSPCIDNYRNHIPADCTNPVRGKCMRDIATNAVEAAIEDLIASGSEACRLTGRV